MSYILDALRKSESERQQGRVPDLAHSVQMVNKPRRKAIPLAAWVALGFFVNALVLAVIFWPGTGFLASSVDAKTDGAESVPSDSSTGSVESKKTGAKSPAVALNKAPVTDSQAAVTPEQSDDESFLQRTEPVDRNLASQASAQENAPAGDRGATPKTSADGSATSSQPAKPDAASAGEQPQDVGPDYVAGAGQQGQQATLIMPDRSRNFAQPYGGSGQSGVQSERPSKAQHLVQKPMAYQRRIPTLRFNSHIYASDPAARRVMINDHYLRVGDRFDGIRVEAINPEGVILSAYGETFRVGVVSDWVSPR